MSSNPINRPELRLRPNGARIRGVRFDYAEHRSVKWNDNVPEYGGTYAVLSLETESGLSGVAEATLKPVWTGASLRSITAVLEDTLLPRLAGVDLFDASAVTAALSPIPENTAAKMLIDNACWDLRAQAAGVPLWQLLGGRRDVPMSWTLTRAAPEAMADEASAMRRQHGFATFKMKGGQGIDIDRQAVRQILKTVGESCTLYVDANWHYTAAQGIDFVKAIADEGAVLAEDPWWLELNDTYRKANATLPIPLMVDYFCQGARDAPAFIEHGARAFSIKPGRIGISDALAMAQVCKASDAQVIVGMFAEMEISTLHTLSFASAHIGRIAAESSFFLLFKQSTLIRPLTIDDGRLQLPETPGFAPLVDWDEIDRHVIA